MCSRASRKVAERRSFWETAWASWPLVSRIFSSSVRTRFGCVLEPAAEDDDLLLQPLELALEVADLAFVLSQTPVVLGSHALTSWIPGCDVPGVGHYTGPFRGTRQIQPVHVAVIPPQHSGVTVSGSRIFPGLD